MKKGFVLISTLALILILSLLILLISRSLYTDSLKTNIFSISVEKRIELINIEKLLVDLLINNSDRLRDIKIAEEEISFFINANDPDLEIEFFDLRTCFNINSLVKPFRELYVKNISNGDLFSNFLKFNEIDINKHRELIDRLYDSLDSDSLPEPFGAEDLFYISEEDLSLNPDQLFVHKSQIKNLSFLSEDEVKQIYPNICTIPETDLTFNINGLSEDNYLVLLSLYPELSYNDIEQLILNKPIEGYINYQNMIDLSGINSDRINGNLLIFKPEYVQIKYSFNIEEQIFSLYSVINLKSRKNNVIYRSTSL